MTTLHIQRVLQERFDGLLRFALRTQTRGTATQPAGSIRSVVHLAWPIAAALLGDALLGLVDAKLVGKLGPVAIGGVGIGLTLMYVSHAPVFGLLRAVKIRTAFATGEGREAETYAYAVGGVLVGATAGFAVALAGRDVTALLQALDLPPALVRSGTTFVAAYSLGAPGLFVKSALIQHRQGLGDTRTPMLVGLGGNAVNAVLAYALIGGHLGLPALGLAGAGYATAVVHTLGAIVLALSLFARWAKAQRQAPKIRFARALREVMELGTPVGLHFFAETLALSSLAAILGRLGEVEIAAHQIGLAIIRASFLPGAAVGEAASILVSQSFGRRQPEMARRSTTAALWIATVFMAGCGVVFAVFGRSIAGAFADDPRVITTTAHLLMIGAVFQVLDAINLVLRGALRGAADVRVVALLGTAIVWISVPSMGYLLGDRLGWGAAGGWVGFIIETTLATLVFGWRWRRLLMRATRSPGTEDGGL